MKVLIQDIKSGQYLAQHGTWTPAADHARDFRASPYARSVLKQERSSGMRVLFYFEDYGYCIKARRDFGDRMWQRLNAAGFDF